MPSNHLILCRPLLLLSIFPSIWVFSSESLYTSGGQRIGVSASTSIIPINIQDWFPLEWTGWISLQFKGLSRVFSNITVQKHQFFGAQQLVSFTSSCLVVSNSTTIWTTAYQGPLFMEFSRQDYWNGLPFPTPGDLPDPGIEPTSLLSPSLADGFFFFFNHWTSWEAQTKTLHLLNTRAEYLHAQSCLNVLICS